MCYILWCIYYKPLTNLAKIWKVELLITKTSFSHDSYQSCQDLYSKYTNIGGTKPMPSIFVFYNCHNKLSQILWLNTAKFFILQFWGPKSGQRTLWAENQYVSRVLSVSAVSAALGRSVSLSFPTSRAHLHFLSSRPPCPAVEPAAMHLFVTFFHSHLSLSGHIFS